MANYLRQYVLVNASNLGPYSVSPAGVSLRHCERWLCHGYVICLGCDMARQAS